MKRDANIDLFRIVATLLVVLLHVTGYGGILNNAASSDATYWAAIFLKIFSCCAVNCFALISGYVMVNKKVRAKKIIGLWFHVLFYSLTLTALHFALVPESRSIKDLAFAFLPILGNRWWYVSSYFALFFLMPFLNAAIQQISRRTYKKFLIVVIIGLCCIDSIVPRDTFALQDGYSPMWLMIVYLFGAYIKKYDVKEKITAAKSILGFAIMIALTFTSKIGIYFLTKSLLGQAKFDNILISYTSVTIFLASVFLFLFCLNIKIRNWSAKLIGFFSPATLGVFLIHVHPLFFNFIIKDAYTSLGQRPSVVMILGVVIITAAIFAVCAVIDLLRIQLFKLIRIDGLCETIGSKAERIYHKIFEQSRFL